MQPEEKLYRLISDFACDYEPFDAWHLPPEFPSDQYIQELRDNRHWACQLDLPAPSDRYKRRALVGEISKRIPTSDQEYMLLTQYLSDVDDHHETRTPRPNLRQLGSDMAEARQ
ncbi:MAG: hypothetical protein ABJH63_10640 [Rhizobiaceae bacterium]